MEMARRNEKKCLLLECKACSSNDGKMATFFQNSARRICNLDSGGSVSAHSSAVFLDWPFPRSVEYPHMDIHFCDNRFLGELPKMAILNICQNRL